MNRKRNTGEEVTYLLATVAGTLLHPVIAPLSCREHPWVCRWGLIDARYSVWGWVRQHFDRVRLRGFLRHPYPWIAFFTSGGGAMFDSPSAGVDRDGSTTGSTSESTPTPTLPPIEEENNETELNNDTQNHE